MAGRRRISSRQCGFTLIESLMAAGVLLIIVTAVGLAVSSGQQHAYWAQQRIAGTLAADELMCRIQATSYDDLARQWDGFEEAPGEMEDANGFAYPANFGEIGRSVDVSSAVKLNPAGSVQILGRTVTVTAFDAEARTLAELSLFIRASGEEEDAEEEK